MKNISSFKSLVKNYDFFLFYQLGVLHNGHKKFPQAEECLIYLKKKNACRTAHRPYTMNESPASRKFLPDDDDELNINPPTPCQIGKRPPAPKPKGNWPAFRESQVEGSCGVMRR